MLRKHNRIFLGIHQGIDLLLVGAAFYAAFYTKIHLLPEQYSGLTPDYDYNLSLLIALVTYHLSFKIFGCYTQYRNQQLIDILVRVVKASVTGTAGIIFISYLLHMAEISRLLLGIFTILSIVFLLLFKTLLYKVLAFNRKRNFNTRNVLIIGSKERAVDFIKVVINTPEAGYRILGCLETIGKEDMIGQEVYGKIRVIGTLSHYRSLLKKTTVDEVIFALPLEQVYMVHKYIILADSMGVNIKIIPDFQIDKIKYLPSTTQTSLFDFLGMPTLSLSSMPQKPDSLFAKNLVDYCGAAAGLVLLSPLFLLIGLLIKLTSKGPVIFSQQRVGLRRS